MGHALSKSTRLSAKLAAQAAVFWHSWNEYGV